MKNLKIFIIVLHYGDICLTLKCLQSLQKINKQSLEVKTMVISNTLVNQSKKEKLEGLCDIFIQNKKNLGFAGGNNIGIKKALRKNADYVLLLNNDTIAYKDLLLYLTKAAEEYLDVGIVGPVIKHKVKNRMLYDYGGVVNWKLGKPYHKNSVRVRPWRPPGSDPEKGLIERDFVSGCCMLVKRAVFEKVGFLNERYFLYLEDVEFCTRAKRAGFIILLNPKPVIFHHGSGTSRSEIKKIFYSFRNALRFIRSFVPLEYKPLAFLYNFLFYPAIFIKWKLSRATSKRFVLGILQGRP